MYLKYDFMTAVRNTISSNKNGIFGQELMMMGIEKEFKGIIPKNVKKEFSETKNIFLLNQINLVFWPIDILPLLEDVDMFATKV